MTSVRDGGERPQGEGSRPSPPDRRLPEPIQSTIRAVLDAAGLDMTDGRDEVDRELRDHFEDGLASGATPEELVARFGDPVAAGRRIAVTRPRAAARNRGERGGWMMWLSEWRSELGTAARRLRHAPAFSMVVIATLGLGVGANTGIFTVLDAVLLEDLPYPEPERLVRIYEGTLEDPLGFWFLPAPVLTEYREWDEVFESLGTLYTYRETGADLTEGDQPRRVTLLRVSAGYFETLGIAPARGRTFREEESFGPGESGGSIGLIAPVTVISHDLWVGQFGADEQIVGRTIRLDDASFEVVGVMPRGFADPFGSHADVWIPQDLRPGGSNSFGNYYLSAVGRLRPGLTIDQAQDRLHVLAEGFAEIQPEVEGSLPHVVPLHDDVVGSTRARMLWILAAAGVLVLLTACLNVANLLLARGLSLDRPLALRSALGAGRGRLIASILTENGLLAVAGGTVGLGVAWLGVRGLVALAPDALPGIVELEMGSRVFAFALGVTVLALFVFGLAPALRLSRTAPADVLRSGDRSSTMGRLARRVRDGLVVAQVAAALVLVTGAVLLTRSFAALTDVPLAVDPRGVMTFEVHLPTARYPEGADRQAFQERLHERIRGVQGVESVGATSWLPVNGRYHIWGFQRIRGDSDEPDYHSSDIRIISGDYFEAMGIDILRGARPADIDYESEPVIWINRTIADDIFEEVDPLGELISVGGGERRRIVGIVEDVPFNARGETSPKLYMPHAQYASDRNWALIQTVRAQGDLTRIRDEIRDEIAAIDGQLVLYRPHSFESALASIRAQDRFATSLMSAFALLALLLSLLGTYGVLAGSVNARTREIGIRMALGADTGSIRQMVLRYATAITVPGIALGLLGAWISSQWLDALLFGVEPTSPWAYTASALLFFAVGLASGWIPARRATRVDTVRVLSAE